jgi:large subunit ribosomal protein L15
VTRASQNAISLVEEKGGKVTTVYTDKQRIHSLLNPEKYMHVPDMVLPPSRRLVGMYADPDRRGYLAPLIQDVERQDILTTILEKTKIPFFNKPY